MKSLLQTFFASIPDLFNVCIFMTFISTIFAIIGVNLFVGTQYQYCRSTEAIQYDANGDPYWPKQPDASWLCRRDDMCSGWPNNLGIDTVAKCGDVYRDYGLDPTIYDGAEENELINFDITNFDSFLNAALTNFQVMTLEGWSQLMYNYSDTVGPIQSSIFFVFVIIIGAWTSMNLVIAAIMYAFIKQTEKETEATKQADQKAKTIEQARDLKKSLSSASLHDEEIKISEG